MSGTTTSSGPSSSTTSSRAGAFMWAAYNSAYGIMGSSLSARGKADSEVAGEKGFESGSTKEKAGETDATKGETGWEGET